MASVINLSKVEKDRAIKTAMQPERERGFYYTRLVLPCLRSSDH